MMTDTPENVSMVPIARIEVLNSRDRNMKVFEEIVESIQLIGLKKPITVAERAGEDGHPSSVPTSNLPSGIKLHPSSRSSSSRRK